MPNFEEYGDVRTVAALAADAEAAGWNGFFVWDHLTLVKAWQLRIADPWLLLAGVALATERLRLGPMVTPLARRRPGQVARATVTPHRLSGGRLVLGEPTDPAVRATMLDEGLEVLTRLWTGETVSFQGRHHRVDQVAFQPTPVQRPRIPIWVAGAWPRRAPLRRAARFDGIAPLDPEDVRGLLEVVGGYRTSTEPFDVAVGGTTPDDPAAARDLLAALAEAGTTWWQESVDPRQTDLEAFRRKVRRGPPGG